MDCGLLYSTISATTPCMPLPKYFIAYTCGFMNLSLRTSFSFLCSVIRNRHIQFTPLSKSQPALISDTTSKLTKLQWNSNKEISKAINYNDILNPHNAAKTKKKINCVMKHPTLLSTFQKAALHKATLARTTYCTFFKNPMG